MGKGRPMITQDRRVRRTQEHLARALIALTLEQGYAAVTIRDITERAGVGYATFFRHYHDKDALLHDVLDVALDELGRLLPPALSAAEQFTVGVLLFRYVQAHSEMVRVLLGSHAVLQRLIGLVTRQIVDAHPPRAESRVPGEIAAYHIATATLALITWWLDHDQPYPPEQMGRIYADLITQPTHALAFA